MLLGYAHGDCCFKLAGQICRGWHGHRELREHGCFCWSSVSLPSSLSCKPNNLSSTRGVTLSALQPQQWQGLAGNSPRLPLVQARQFATQDKTRLRHSSKAELAPLDQVFTPYETRKELLSPGREGCVREASSQCR